MHIQTKSELEAWLRDNFWLEDMVVKAIAPLPAQGSEMSNTPPKVVNLSGQMQVGGSYQAGEVRWVRDIKITAHGVKSYSMGLGGFIEDYYSEGAHPLKSSELGFLLHVPGELRIVCDSIEVSQTTDRAEAIKPWFSTIEFFAYARLSAPPTPTDWIEHLRRRGWDVVWRYHHSEAQPLERVPAKDYSGWFIQLRSRISQNPQGLFFKHCQVENDRFSLSLSNYDPAIQSLWIELGKYVATFPGIKVSCGNAELDRTEWLSYLSELSTQLQ